MVSQLLLGLLVAGTTGLLLVQLRQPTLAAARPELQSLALTLADKAERAFDAVDLLQTTFLEMTRVIVPDRRFVRMRQARRWRPS